MPDELLTKMRSGVRETETMESSRFGRAGVGWVMHGGDRDDG